MLNFLENDFLNICISFIKRLVIISVITFLVAAVNAMIFVSGKYALDLLESYDKRDENRVPIQKYNELHQQQYSLGGVL